MAAYREESPFDARAPAPRARSAAGRQQAPDSAKAVFKVQRTCHCAVMMRTSQMGVPRRWRQNRMIGQLHHRRWGALAKNIYGICYQF